MTLTNGSNNSAQGAAELAFNMHHQISDGDFAVGIGQIVSGTGAIVFGGKYSQNRGVYFVAVTTDNKFYKVRIQTYSDGSVYVSSFDATSTDTYTVNTSTYSIDQEPA